MNRAPHQPMTEDHPDVRAYLASAGELLRQAELAAHIRECPDPMWHEFAPYPGAPHTHTHTNWWRIEHGGIARPEAVAAALGRYPDMRLADARVVFAAAALAVLRFPTHPAHWAFWAHNARDRVATLVNEYACANPPLIEAPSGAAWIDMEYGLRALRTYERGFIPTFPRPSASHVLGPKQPTPPPPQKSRVVPKRATAQRKRTVATVATALEEKNANGKRRAPSDDATETVDKPAPKRARRSKAAGGTEAGKKKVEEKGKVAAGRGTRASTAQPPAKASQPQPAPAPAKKARARPDAAAKRSRAKGKSVKNAPAPPAITIVLPEQEADETMDVDVGEPELPPSGRAHPSPPAAAASSSPTPETSGSSPASAKQKKAPRRSHLRAPSAATSDTSEQSAALSASTTVVPSVASSDTASTRAPTPLESAPEAIVLADMVQQEKVPVDIVREKKTKASCTPVRMSARLQARKGRSSA